MTTKQQLELGFNGTQSRLFGRRRETRVARAQWWFAQMRAAVAGAISGPPAEPPSDQFIFSATSRAPKA